MLKAWQGCQVSAERGLRQPQRKQDLSKWQKLLGPTQCLAPSSANKLTPGQGGPARRKTTFLSPCN